ncbi:hypothetical protein [Microbacterium abyssi]|uniref:hypothetical protein n=1 Tax=Microbacterium abyssi TaxID=2782166 RepID=UPI0018890A99|nr:hypothetical protein [Microbacterium sp. A18JL241]
MRARTRWRLPFAAMLVIAAVSLAIPASAQWSATARATVAVTAGYPALPVNNGQWLSCRGPQQYNGYSNSIGGDFQAIQYRYRDQIPPVFTNFRVYRTVGGVTRSDLWSTAPTDFLGIQSSYNYMFHDRGTAFYNLPADNSPMQVYVRPVYDGGWLGPASNTITIYPQPDLSQSYCQT